VFGVTVRLLLKTRVNVRVKVKVRMGTSQMSMVVILRVRYLGCSCCCDSQAPIRLEMTSGQKIHHTWLRATESDLKPLNIGPSYTRGISQPLENTGVRLWIRLRSRRVCNEKY